MGYRDRTQKRTGRREQQNSPYLRVTGLWPSKKKENLWTGKLRAHDIEQLIDKCQEALDAGNDMVFFLWENAEQTGPKDPDFTIQVSISVPNTQGQNAPQRRGVAVRREAPVQEEQDEPAQVEEAEPVQPVAARKPVAKKPAAPVSNDW